MTKGEGVKTGQKSQIIYDFFYERPLGIILIFQNVQNGYLISSNSQRTTTLMNKFTGWFSEKFTFLLLSLKIF